MERQAPERRSIALLRASPRGYGAPKRFRARAADATIRDMHVIGMPLLTRPR
jgi:hypothetical protein